MKSLKFAIFEFFSDGKLFSKKNTVYKTQRLNKFKKKQYKTTANLITGSLLF